MENQKQNPSKETKKELLKEALRRAKKEEKQKHERISNRQAAIAERLIVIWNEFEELSKSNERNECPKNMATPNQNKLASEMSNEEFSEWSKQNSKHFDEHFEWTSKTLKIMTQQMKIINEIMELMTELCSLETEEKWLLLSIALRSQPNLLKYFEIEK